jgi:hypothetical protein
MYQNLVLFLSPFNTLLGVLTIDQTLKCQTEVLTFVPDLTYPVLGYDFEFENGELNLTTCFRKEAESVLIIVKSN